MPKSSHAELPEALQRERLQRTLRVLIGAMGAMTLLLNIPQRLYASAVVTTVITSLFALMALSVRRCTPKRAERCAQVIIGLLCLAGGFTSYVEGFGTSTAPFMMMLIPMIAEYIGGPRLSLRASFATGAILIALGAMKTDATVTINRLMDALVTLTAMTLLTRGHNNLLRGYVQQLNQTNLKLREAAQARSRFLANVSHEIRTPLNGVLGMADFL